MLERLNKELLLFDGGMGTQLQNAGLKAGDIPEELNIDQPELIISIHERYLNAGASFITTNTFGCNPIKMKASKYTYEEMLKAAVNNAHVARQRAHRENDAYIVLDIGPIGQLLAPLGTLTFDEAYDIILSQINCVKDDVDVVLFETMSDLYEVKAGILSIKENTNLPVFVTMTFEASKRTLTGTDVITFINVAEGLHVDALGVNCSLGPDELTPIVDDLVENAHVPIIIQPNAGLPIYQDGKTLYKVDADAFTKTMQTFVDKGVSVVGGCCGTTPEFISKMNTTLDKTLHVRNNPYKTRVSSATKTVTFNGQVVVCGERLNPTGKKKMKQALNDANYDVLINEALAQVNAGADVLDVNVGLPTIDEVETMKTVVPLLQEVIDLPLQIDSSSKDAIEVACRYYNGKPLINSVNGNQEVLDAILPIVYKYGGVVIGLTLETGIPKKAEERFEIAKKIISNAISHGIKKQDVIIDTLTLTASAQQKEVQETLKALQMVKDYGHECVLGVSNVSFGLPNRPLLNRTFLALAMQSGLTLPIINPLDSQLMGTIDAYNVLYNYDIDSANYVEKHANDVVSSSLTQTQSQKEEEKVGSLEYAIYKGLKDQTVNLTLDALTSKEPMQVINELIIPALNEVGEDYEKGKIFLPQLIQAAESSKLAFEKVQERISVSDDLKKGPILILTVEGDIHDIGKNIVKVVCESYGYQMIDLGKDVKVEKVVEACKEYKPLAIGLSALMTTTVVNMQKTIDALREINCDCPIWVGGAVLTEDIAKNIGADYYSKDAMDSVNLLNKIIK